MAYANALVKKWQYSRLFRLLANGCGRLAFALAEVVELGAADGTLALDFDFGDARRVEREYALDTLAVAHAADGEFRVDARAALADDDARIYLRAFLVAFHNARVHLHGVADVECRTVCLELFTFYFFDNRHIA